MLFPHSHKDRCTRVNLGHFTARASPLRQELLPGDVSDPPDVTQSNSSDYEYDWDYVASTDPLHPVDVNYAHQMDSDDPSWVLDHLSSEELEQSHSGIGLDASEADRTWAAQLGKSDMSSEIWTQDEGPWLSDVTSVNTTRHDAEQDPESEESPELTATSTTPSKWEKLILAERVEMVIHEFWRVVNGEDLCEQPPQRPSTFVNDGLSDPLKAFCISDPTNTSTQINTSLLTPPPTPPRPRTDGIYDQESPSPTTNSAANPVPNSTRALYDK